MSRVNLIKSIKLLWYTTGMSQCKSLDKCYYIKVYWHLEKIDYDIHLVSYAKHTY